MADSATESGGNTKKPLARVYRIVREHVGAGTSASFAAEGAAAGQDRPELVRWCQRLGAIPRSWTGTKAADAARAALRDVAAASGDSPEQVCAAVLGFCSDEGERSPCGRLPQCAECPIEQYCDYPQRKPTIKDLPKTERPRERLLAAGQEALSDVELLAIILRGGAEGATALDLAGRLLSTFGSFRRLADCTAGELTRVRGIGPAKAAQVKAALAIAHRYAGEKLSAGDLVSGSEHLYAYMREKLAGLQKEHFYTLMLDTKHRIIREERVAVGSLSESVVHPREVFKNAIRESAAAVIFVHNHPSGNPEPSPQDRTLTARLCEAGRIVGIQVLDHLIVGRDGYYSFAERGQLGTAGTRSP